MLGESLRLAWAALARNPLRSLLTMLGIVWGIVCVAVLIAYGSGFRAVILAAFDAFGRSAVVAWPGQTSEQAGGERAGRPVRFEREDLEAILAEATLVRGASLETVRWLPVTYGDRLRNTAIRGVFPVYGEIRNQVPGEGRFINHEDMQERRRVIFLGGRLRQRLFGSRPAMGEVVRVGGVPFTVIGAADRKIQFSNYFTSDEDSAWIPWTTAGTMWNNRYSQVIVFAAVAPPFEPQAIQQVRAALAKRQRFSPTDRRAIQAFGREEFRPVIEGITVGLQVLVGFIGALTLAIGGVGVMNIMLVSVEERTREIGLRRALGARRGHIRLQFLTEALVLTAAGGLVGILLSHGIAALLGEVPLLGPLFEREDGAGNITLRISWNTMLASTVILMLVGVASGWMPARRAARLDPVAALRYE